MKRHPLDTVSLVFALLFGAAVAWWGIARITDDFLHLPAAWIGVGTLLVIGVVGLVSALRPRRDPPSGAGVHDPGPAPAPAALPDRTDETLADLYRLAEAGPAPRSTLLLDGDADDRPAVGARPVTAPPEDAPGARPAVSADGADGSVAADRPDHAAGRASDEADPGGVRSEPEGVPRAPGDVRLDPGAVGSAPHDDRTAPAEHLAAPADGRPDGPDGLRPGSDDGPRPGGDR